MLGWIILAFSFCGSYFLMFLFQVFHPWGSGQAPRKCVRAPAAVCGGSPDALLAMFYAEMFVIKNKRFIFAGNCDSIF